MLQKKEFKSRQPNVGMMGRPSRRRERSQPARLRLRRQSLPTGLPSPMAPRQRLRRQCLLTGLPGPKTRRSPSHPACLWWEVPGLTVAQCLPGPTVLNTTDHAVVIGVDEVTGQTRFATIRQGPGRHHREGPALEPGTLIRRMFRGLVVLQIGRRRSGLPAQPLVIIVIRHGHHWLSKPTESSRQRLGTSTWLSRGWLGTTTRLGTCRIGKEWRASSPGYSGRDCTSR